MSPFPRSGYTLPVFACAAAIAALRWLRQPQNLASVSLDLIEPAQTVEIPIEQVSGLKAGVALAITRSDPGDNLDLTRNTPVWALVEAGAAAQTEPILLLGGEGIGRHRDSDTSEPAIYAYARRLFQENLSRWLQPGEKIQVTVILPQGRSLAQRTSNEAFGVVEGLSLLGTTGISQPLSAPQQLETFRTELQKKAIQWSCLVFCIGENGLDMGRQLGINPARLIKTANWIGPLLVEAGLQGVKSILLLGYHGKLIKLAGGIFHTHHQVADCRQEIFTAYAANLGLPLPLVQDSLCAATTEAALVQLRRLDQTTGSNWVNQLYDVLSQQIDRRSQAYILTHSDRQVEVGSLLFDRQRDIIATSPIGTELLRQGLT